MEMRSLDHVNVRTSRLEEMVAWYGEVLDMHPGFRPDFSFPGAWLYAAGKPIVHLVFVEKQPEVTDTQLEHFAIGATGLGGFVERLKAKGVEYRPAEIADAGIVQINIWDPDNNHIHIDFPLEEAAGLDL